MAKKKAASSKKTSSSGKKKATTRKKKTSAASGKKTAASGSGGGRHLVIVESPTKAKTINKYLGRDYTVMASAGHVRDLPSKSPKGEKQDVPGVDVDRDFAPTYEIVSGKKQTVEKLKKAAKQAEDVYFATDLDREGEAIAWHLYEALDIAPEHAKRVVFNAITRDEIQRAFEEPREINAARVNAQQARRILDRLVGYQVSPLLWKKITSGLSAGRVQSVATRLVVDREREIEAFVPDEYWRITGVFTPRIDEGATLSRAWHDWLAEGEDGRTNREKADWLSEHTAFTGELVAYRGQSANLADRDAAIAAAEALGLRVAEEKQWEDPEQKGPARNRVRVETEAYDDAPRFVVGEVTTKRQTTNPAPPFITSTLQQQAANRLGFTLRRTMRVAQALYEGVDLKDLGGQTGLITYMRTDSTHVAQPALEMVRDHIQREHGAAYLPERPRVYRSSNQQAQEAHEAIRPTDVSLTPERVRPYLNDEQLKLYELIWRRFVACQMTGAQWDQTTVMIHPAADRQLATFKTTGRRLAFDGFYRVTGVPKMEEPILPALEKEQSLAALQVAPTQHFTSPPPRYTEASLQKKLEQEGIGRPSTYAPIIQTIQDREYVEPLAPRDKRFRATDLGRVVTDMLVESFPHIMDVAYTRYMENELDEIEEEKADWVKMLKEFYGPFKERLDTAYEQVQHAKAVTEPADHVCPKCGAATEYRFGKKGRFLSCTQYPDCDYAAPVDRAGNPKEPELTDIRCPECGGGMTKRDGRYGPFLGCENYPQCRGIVNLDKQGGVKLPKPPPLETELDCPKCGENLYLRNSQRGPWLSCSKFPKCRGRLGWSKLEEETQRKLEKQLAEHEKQNPQPEIRTRDGEAVSEGYIPEIVGTVSTGTSAGGNGDASASGGSGA